MSANMPAFAGEKQVAREGGRFKKGASGNPAGRRRGASSATQLRVDIAKHIPDIVKQLVIAASAGDVQAARLLMERVLPPLRPVEQPLAISLPEGDLTTKGLAILAAAARGELGYSQAVGLISAVGGLARVAEVDELARRITALEAQRGGK